MPLALAVALLALPFQSSSNELRPGEQWVELATLTPSASEAAEAYVHAHGRVVDAFTGLPIAGATVETWTEEITNETLGLKRMGEATTRSSGQFTIRMKEGDLDAEKGRVRAPGYATLSCVAEDLVSTIELFPLGETAPRIRFRASDGSPILEGRITSTRTCAHDLPAFTIFPDATGVFALPELAYQDKLQELRFLAPGYVGIKYLDCDPLFDRNSQNNGIVERHVPFVPHASVRLLDEEERPIAHEPLYVLDSGDHHVVRTDRVGRFRLPGRLNGSELTVFVLAKDDNVYVDEVDAWMQYADQEFVLIQNRGRWNEEEQDCGTIRVVLPADLDEDDAPSFDFVHDRGWRGGVSLRSEVPNQSSFPEGWVTIGWGSPFRYVLPGSMKVELEEGQTIEVAPDLEFASLVEFEIPDGLGWLWFEVDGMGSTTLGSSSSQLWVPKKRPWRCGFEFEGLSYVRELEPVTADTRLDLALVLPEFLPEPVPKAMSSVLVRVLADSDPSEVDCWPGKIANWDGEEPEPEREGNEWLIHGPAGHTGLVVFEAPGYLDAWARVEFPPAHKDGSRREPLVVPMTRAAKLELTMPDAWVIDFGPNLREGLPPGPTEFVISNGEGRRFGLILQLEEGEARALDLEQLARELDSGG